MENTSGVSWQKSYISVQIVSILGLQNSADKDG